MLWLKWEGRAQALLKQTMQPKFASNLEETIVLLPLLSAVNQVGQTKIFLLFLSFMPKRIGPDKIAEVEAEILRKFVTVYLHK